MPALCGRADDAHAKARWQGVARWRWDGEAEGEGRRSEASTLALQWLSSQRLLLANHPTTAVALALLLGGERSAVAAVDPAALRPLRRGDAAPKKKGKRAGRARRRLAAALDRLEGMQLWGGVGDAARPRPPQRWRRVAVPFEPRLVLTADRVGVSGGVGADAAGGVASLQLSLELEALQLSLTRLRGWLPRAALPDAPLERRASRHLSEEGQKQAEAERERPWRGGARSRRR